MPAVLFGSISTLADTSEHQRHAFNDAFRAHDLPWTWEREDYAAMLEKNGGQQRIADYAEAHGTGVDAAAVQRTKSELFRQRLATEPVTARPGVAETVREAREQGYRVGLVTTTSPENVTALLGALSSDLGEDAFDLVLDRDRVSANKPDPAAYRQALDTLGLTPDEAVAIEDNVGGTRAAVDAGLRCVAFPNANTAGHTFDGATDQVDALRFDGLRALIEPA